MQTETQVIGAELERVNSKVPVLFETEARFYSTIEKRNVEVISNRDMRIPMELRPGGNVGQFDPDGGDLGLGDGPTFDKAVINTVNIREAFQWTKKAEWVTDDKRKAVINTFRHLLAKGMQELRRHLDSLSMGDGTGVLATISAVSTSSGTDTLTLGTDGFGARLLRFGQTIDIYDTTLATYRGSTKITFLDLANKQIKCASVASTTATDKIVINNAGLTASQNGTAATPPISIKGVAYHHNSASTGTWLGYDRANTPEIRANSVSASGASFTAPLARLAMNKMGDRVGMEEKVQVVAWMHPCQKQVYESLGQAVSIIQKQPKDEALDLYFGDNMQIAGASIKESYSWDKKRIDFINASVWGRAEMYPASFYEVDGRRIFELRGPSGGVATSQIFYICCSFNEFVMNPAACTYIADLAVPNGY